ncbi:hypothetical protein AK812_SmicGene45283, partial [Symbiodinium microadriaticum]
ADPGSLDKPAEPEQESRRRRYASVEPYAILSREAVRSSQNAQAPCRKRGPIHDAQLQCYGLHSLELQSV